MQEHDWREEVWGSVSCWDNSTSNNPGWDVQGVSGELVKENPSAQCRWACARAMWSQGVIKNKAENMKGLVCPRQSSELYPGALDNYQSVFKSGNNIIIFHTRKVPSSCYEGLKKKKVMLWNFCLKGNMLNRFLKFYHPKEQRTIFCKFFQNIWRCQEQPGVSR